MFHTALRLNQIKNLMKKLMLIIASMLPAMLWAQAGNYRIEGKITSDNPPEHVYLTYGKSYPDSAKVVDGNYVFTGKVDYITTAWLIASHDGKPFDRERDSRSYDVLFLYLEGGAPTIKVNSGDSVKYGKITESQINADYKRFLDATDPYESQVDALEAKYAEHAANPDSLSVGQAEYFRIMKERDAAIRKFMGVNPDSFINYRALELLMMSDNGWDPDQLEALMKGMSEKVRNSEQGKSFAAEIKAKQTIYVGRIAPEFTQDDADGNPVSLADFRGRYVLVDFWASWCAPCRDENPTVVKAYERFHDKGLEIIGVSLDEKKDAWLAAIKKDGLLWLHVSDLKGWYNAVAQLYGVKSVPANFLIDPQGRIIAVDLRGAALEQKLEEVLGKM